MKKTHVALGLLAAAAFVGSTTTGCGSDGGDTGSGGAGTGGSTTDGGAGPGPGPGPGPGGGNTGGNGTGGGGGMDESTSCADAPDMETGMGGLGNTVFVGNGFLQNGSDADFFKFDATEGDWLNIITIANENDDSAFIDTVIRLYDEDGNTLLAQADDAFPRVTTDSEMVYHVPATGTYCLEVVEWGEWTGTPVDKTNNQYSAQVIPIDFDLFDGYDEETEPNDDSGTANSGLSATNPQMNNPMSAAVYFEQVAGLLDPGTDADWYEITLPAAANGFYLNLNPDGVGDAANNESGWGSTGGPGVINLYNSSVQLVASVDSHTHQPQGLDGMSGVPVTGGQTYFLEVTRPDMNVGANDFYFLPFYTLDDSAQNPQEMNDVANDAVGGAEVMEANPVTPEGFIQHFIGGSLPDGDTDFWAFPNGGEPQPGEELVVVCSSWAAGSGVRGMTVTHWENGSATAKTQVEDPAKGILWSNGASPLVTDPAITITTTGPHAIELTNDDGSGNGDTTAQADHYLCGIHRSTMP